MKKYLSYAALTAAVLATTSLSAMDVLNEDTQKIIISQFVIGEEAVDFEVKDDDSYQRGLTIKCKSPIPLVSRLWKEIYYSSEYKVHLSLDAAFFRNPHCFGSNSGISTKDLASLITNEDGAIKSSEEIIQYFSLNTVPREPFPEEKLKPLLEQHSPSVRSLKILNDGVYTGEGFSKEGSPKGIFLSAILSHHFPSLSSLTLDEDAIGQPLFDEIKTQCPLLKQLCLLKNPSLDRILKPFKLREVAFLEGWKIMTPQLISLTWNGAAISDETVNVMCSTLAQSIPLKNLTLVNAQISDGNISQLRQWGESQNIEVKFGQ